jgi:predicted small lipoprotein YifL
MKKIILIPLLLIFAMSLSGCGNKSNVYYFDENGNMTTTKPAEAKLEAADKLEVVYFHRTARCYSCNTLGGYVESLINSRYSKQVNDGKLDFKVLNVELPENNEIAKKYKASGSSLFINRIINEEDNIEQDTNVWRYIGNEGSFNNYLGEKIDSYLGM